MVDKGHWPRNVKWGGIFYFASLVVVSSIFYLPGTSASFAASGVYSVSTLLFKVSLCLSLDSAFLGWLSGFQSSICVLSF